MTNISAKILILICLQAFSSLALADNSFNKQVLATIKEMPSGGGYNAQASTLELLKNAIVITKNNLEVHADKAQPSFCSSATYLVFLKTIAQLQAEKKLSLSEETQKELLVLGAKEQPDGTGIWGRWNANGPGTARLFSELNLGRNFELDKISEAQPGDFMKIFWTDEIGAKEKGHSVVFMGTDEKNNEKQICFWSSNSASKDQPAGMGTKCVAASKVHRAIFSRLEFPENLNHAAKVMGPATAGYTDVYLHSLLQEVSTVTEMRKQIGLDASFERQPATTK